jgi:hypothetical protein
MRVRRRLFNLATALTLFFCAVAALLWMRSEFRSDDYTHVWSRPEGDDHCIFVRHLHSANGELSASATNFRTQDPSALTSKDRELWTFLSARSQLQEKRARRWVLGSPLEQYVPPSSNFLGRLGFGAKIMNDTGALRVRGAWLKCPLWFVTLLLGVLPAIWLLRHPRLLKWLLGADATVDAHKKLSHDCGRGDSAAGD